MLKASTYARIRMRPVSARLFSARTSNTQMLSERLASFGSTKAVPLAVRPEPAGAEIVSCRAKLTPDWWRSTGEIRMPYAASYEPDALKLQIEYCSSYGRFGLSG